MPVAIATTFFIAPADLAADDVVVRVDAEHAAAQHGLQRGGDRQVLGRHDAGGGLPAMISFARFGPVSAATGRPGSTSLATSVMRRCVARSRPLLRLMTGIHGDRCGRASSSVARNALVGTPTTSSSAWRAACSRSAVAARRGGSAASGR
jgi:hypothetical protein